MRNSNEKRSRENSDEEYCDLIPQEIDEEYCEIIFQDDDEECCEIIFQEHSENNNMQEDSENGNMQESSSDESQISWMEKRKKPAPRSKKMKLNTPSAMRKKRNTNSSVKPKGLRRKPSISSETSNEPSVSASQSTRKNEDLKSLLSLSSYCKKHLMRVVSNAIQLQRHNQNSTLSSSHFSQALALEKDFQTESDDSEDYQDLKDLDSAPASEEIRKQPE